MSDLPETLRKRAAICVPGGISQGLLINAAIEIENQRRDLDEYRKATGGLPAELVAKALAYSWGRTPVGMSAAELEALRAATFEAPT